MSTSQLPLVSVLMPAYNVEAYVSEAIQSVLNQTYPHFELLIADDHSNDRTLELISSFADERIVLLKNERNLGYAENMNLLFKTAKGKYLVIQDADDYCTTNRFEVLVNFLEKNESIDMVGSSYSKVDGTGKEEKIILSDDAETIATSFATLQDPLPVLNGSVMFRRKITDEGYIFRSLVYVNRGQDDDWLFRVAEKFTLSNVKECLYYYRYNPSSMTMNFSAMTYKSLFSGEYVRFLKTKRIENGVDLLSENRTKEIDTFFEQKAKQLTDQQAAYLEIYIAHKYLALGKRTKTLQWLLKALLKNPGDAFIWKKIIFVLTNRKN